MGGEGPERYKCKHMAERKRIRFFLRTKDTEEYLLFLNYCIV